MRPLGKTAPSQLTLPAWPHFDEQDLAAVERVLRSGKVNYWTGEEGRLFEQEYAAYVGTKYAVVVANGTVALELGLRALGIGPGDEVIVPARTFIASASCVGMLGATPVFADVDLQSQNITAETIGPHLTSRTRAVIVVHLAGCPCEMDPILELARQHGLKVIEDCAQAHGARYKGRPVGSMGDLGAFSFCQDKIITTGGEGGMLTLNDGPSFEFAGAFRDHGRAGAERVLLGTNWRLTEMQSALGRNGLRRLDAWVQGRRRNAATLESSLRESPAVRLSEISSSCYHSYYKLYVFLAVNRLREGWTRDRIVLEMNEAGIPCSCGGLRPLPLESVFSRGAGNGEALPVSQELAATSLMFLVHPTLQAEHLEWIGHVAKDVLGRASGSE